jgi:hypothetical protein
MLLALCFSRLRLHVSGSSRGWVLVGAMSWLGYATYECVVWIWSQDVIAPIRIDLLLIAPLLYVVSFLAVRQCWRARKREGAV